MSSKIEVPIEDLGGGLNQSDAQDSIPIRECLEIENFRVPRNNKTKIKRKGLSKVDSLYSFGTKSVYGGFGIVVEDETKLLACLEDDIQLKYGGAWNSVFTPTEAIDRPVSFAKDKGLTFIAGYEKLITIKGNDAFYSGIEAPDSAPTVATQAASSGNKELEHATSNQDNIGELRQNNARTLLSQSFISFSGDISDVILKLKKIGSPSGNVWVEIHSSTTGTSATKNASTNIVGEASDNIACTAIGTAWASHTFTFSGVEPPTTFGTTYYIVVYGDFAVSASAFVCVGLDASSPGQSDGVYYEINSSFAWSDYEDVDLVYEVYVGGFIMKRYNFSNQDVTYELRADNATTLMAQSFIAPKDGGVYSVKLYLSKLGAPAGNVWVEIHSAQGGTSTTKDASTNIVGTASDNIAITAINALGTYALHEFVFSGTQPPLTQNNTYYLVVYASYAVSATVHVLVGHDKLAEAFEGSRWDINAALAWAERDFISILFELYMAPDTIVGDYKYLVTYYRGGNYPCESNPSPESDAVSITSGKEFTLSSIPVSSESEVTKRRIWRTKADGAIFYWLIDIDDNTTTTLTDAMSDASLGDEVSYESYVPPVGKRVANWDNRLWVARVSGYEEDLFRSGNGTPEQFGSTAISRIPLRERETDYVQEIVEFKNNLYALKRKVVWMVVRSGASDYIVDTVVENMGTASGDSVAVCNKGKYLIFLSNHYRIEIFDGFNIITPPEMTDKVKDTLDGINKDVSYLASGDDYPEKGEYRLAIPTGTSQDCDKTIVFDYINGNFYVDDYHEDLCSVNLMDISRNERFLVYGSSNGGFYKVDETATLDDATAITGNFRTGWIGGVEWQVLRKMFMTLRLPENKTLTLKIYKNFEATAHLTLTINGNTPSGSDATLRDIIHYRTDLYVPGNYFSFEFINAEDVGGDLEVIKLWLTVRRQRHKYGVSAAT